MLNRAAVGKAGPVSLSRLSGSSLFHPFVSNWYAGTVDPSAITVTEVNTLLSTTSIDAPGLKPSSQALFGLALAGLAVSKRGKQLRHSLC